MFPDPDYTLRREFKYRAEAVHRQRLNCLCCISTHCQLNQQA